MSQTRDPLELMPRFIDPEPDPVIMNATIAQSREAFTNRKPRTSHAGSMPLADRFRRSARWLVPAGSMAVALVVVIAVAPGLLGTSPERMADQEVAETTTAMPPTSTTMSRGNNQVADMPADESRRSRMGMTVPPATGETPIARLPQVISSFQGDGVRLGLRLDVEALEIYLPELSGEKTIDAQSVLPGETVEILSAFMVPDSQLLAIQIRVDDVRFWRVYHLVDGTYARDPQRSTLVSNAADRAEVERRLGGN